MAKRSYTLFCDESVGKGRYYSNFYGGVLVRTAEREAIEAILQEKKDSLNLFGELKWTKITENYKEKYIDFIDEYIDLIRDNRMKVRVMFTQNRNQVDGLTQEQLENRYFLLYYQLIKNAFGFHHCNPRGINRVVINVLLDELPDTNARCNDFKDHISEIGNRGIYKGKGITFPRNQIADVNSRNHCILQGLDIILGAIQFRLNDKHKVKPEGSYRRARRTVAKDAVYKHIRSRINEIRPGFNVGVSTKMAPVNATWVHPYRHWLFVPTNSTQNDSLTKRRAAPPQPTLNS